MKQLLSWMVVFSMFMGGSAFAQKDRNVAEYNLNLQGVGMIDGANKSIAKGFDPVAYFPEGGGVALEGKAEFALMHEGVEYLFATAENMKLFPTNPEKFEPTYGGYCARAMVVGQKVHINTRLFTVHNGRSFFFVNSRAKRFFDRNLEENIRLADEQWKRISGEAPRIP